MNWTSMPKTAIDKDRDPELRKSDISDATWLL